MMPPFHATGLPDTDTGNGRGTQADAPDAQPIAVPVKAACLPEVWWHRDFPAVPESVGRARRFLAECLDGAPITSDALLCLSELAANAVLHSRSAHPGGQFTVRVRRAPGWLRVEVTDEGGPWKRRAPGETHGRGLLVVELLADLVHFGDMEIDSPSRTIMFEMVGR